MTTNVITETYSGPANKKTFDLDEGEDHFVVTHNLGTQDFTYAIRLGDGSEVMIKSAEALGLNQLEIFLPQPLPVGGGSLVVIG